MLILLSPAKSLDFETPAPVKTGDVPRFLDEQTASLVTTLRRKKTSDLVKLMDLSSRLAELNYNRFQSFDADLIRTPVAKSRSQAGPLPVKQAMWAFTGDVYQGLDATSMTAPQRKMAQQRIRMLSGLYGVLRPYDLMLPYRLEMGTRLKTRQGKDLYQFWGSAITEALAEEQPDWICNLASKEYYRSVREKELPCPVVHPVFKDEVKGEFRAMGMFAKYARGLMARWIVDKKITTPAHLSKFNVGGYRYEKSESEEAAPVFKRPATAR
ncbi:MAG: peroxide stress protein YaaA [Gemmatimonadetes bacterium]|jgi:hypothetical protein|nr:peroxide stress protein YaaA [Gemmatimonadota bacterium]MBT5060052.1 peroxide stress protein YaaA [Gemmatimonadota bacterium]MBT5144889.1 peroxide stress protein YaaA [Gemmatimonadota bacterium]MBT5960113.1 peroxide stress protein YaaA [Gemmatimonadota bacterium]MBT6631329.1 peroxide stress protein YaaA [Gemmatimonadota bacterium]